MLNPGDSSDDLYPLKTSDEKRYCILTVYDMENTAKNLVEETNQWQ